MKRSLLLLLTGVISSVSYSQTTWSDQAAQVFYNNCTQCHNPNGIGPFSLLDYATAYDYRASIKDAVLNNIMPPWPADSSYQHYFHERLLTQAERDIIINWVDE
ncbi:MAG: cytochrome c, partial [Crocinitomicaceae bacterium]|nr:cytochrome c [Crocinitomicaceae bacterium]